MRHPTANWIPSPNFGYPMGTHGQVKPLAKVYHIAAGSLAGMDSWFSNPDSSASAHFGIGVNGEIHQYADTLDACWHAGIVLKPDMSIPLIQSWVNNRLNPNFFTIGIEHEGQSGDIPTPAQWDSSIQLSIWLDDNHPTLGNSINEHLRHSQIDSVNRAGDPGSGYNILQLTEEHHMPQMTEEQKINLVVSELLPNLVDVDAALVRMGLRQSGALDALRKAKTGGKPALVELKALLEDLKSKDDYIKLVQAVSALENQLTFLGV